MTIGPSLRPGFRTAAIGALLFGGTLLLYGRALDAGFVIYDDPIYVTENLHVQAGLSWAGVSWAFTVPGDYWQPLVWLSHMLDWQLYGAAPAGHHLTSVAWHAINAVLVFLVFERLAGGVWRSAFAAALFAWHPLRVESVAWIAERKDVMSACFFLLALLAYARHATAIKRGRPAWRTLLPVFAAFVAGLMCKPMVVTLPVILLLFDFWPLARVTSTAASRRVLLEKIPFFAVSIAIGVLTLEMQKHVGAFVLELPLTDRLANAVVALLRYPGMFVWPFDLVVCYPHPGSWPAPIVIGSLAVTAGFAWLAWSRRREQPWIAVGLAWYGVMLLPVIGLVQVGFQSIADRYTYLPLLGLEFALIWSLPPLARRSAQIAAGVLAGAVLAGCTALTWTQESVWHDSVTLFTHAARATNPNDVAETFLASALFAEDRLGEAETHAGRALTLNPRNDRAMAALANIRERQMRFDDAIDLYRAALGLRPGQSGMEGELGLLLLTRDRGDEARPLLTAALRAAPEFGEKTREIAAAEMRHGNVKAARILYESEVAAWPTNAAAEARLGYALLVQGDAAGAVGQLRASVERDPAAAEAQLALAAALEQLGKKDEATVAIEKALADAPKVTAVLSAAAGLYSQRRDFTAAATLYRRVIEVDPRDASAHAALGYMLVFTGDRSGGVAEWRRALEIEPDFPGLREQLRNAEKPAAK